MAKSFSQNKWNITKIEGDKIAYDMIYEVLFESNKDILEINELINLLNGKKHLVIKYNNKKERFSIGAQPNCLSPTLT